MQGRRNDIHHTHPPNICKQIDSPICHCINDRDSRVATQSSSDCKISVTSPDGILSDPGLRFAKSTESVHYHQSYGCYHSSGASCHGRFEKTVLRGLQVQESVIEGRLAEKVQTSVVRASHKDVAKLVHPSVVITNYQRRYMVNELYKNKKEESYKSGGFLRLEAHIMAYLTRFSILDHEIWAKCIW